MKNIKALLSDLFLYKEKKDYNFSLPETMEEKAEIMNSFSDKDLNKDEQYNALDEPNKKIYPTLSVNLEYMKVRFNTLINSDVKIREFTLNARNKQYSAFIMYIDGMINSKILNGFVLQPLMLKNKSNTFENDQNKVVATAISDNITVKRIKKFNLVDYIYNCLVPQNDIKKSDTFESIIEGINEGSCVLFIDTLDIAFVLDVKELKQRSINIPQNEVVVRGSQEAFVEVLRTNTSILRRLINNENLVIETINVGKVSKTKTAICYMKNIANDDLVAEVKYRINNLNIDYLYSSGQLEQLIEDNTNNLPQIIATERPDRAVNFLLQGRVIVILNGTPYVLVMPSTFLDFLSSAEDENIRPQFANLLKILRAVALIITLLLPGLYIAITNYHQELIPTELLFSIIASRESVPFPTIFEIIVMEVSFELIREAGLRVPSPIGPTIGIVGGLILGQAAVDASIVSPILIIIVALTGIASFAIPAFSLSFYFRISRFGYIVLGYIFGFLGIAIVFFLQVLVFCNMKSFGVSYLAPYTPVTNINNNGYLMSNIWQKDKRPDFLNTKRPKTQDKISMGWKKKSKEV